MCTKLDYRLNTEAKAKLQEVLEDAYLHRDQSFGNGRMVRNLFEKTIENQANRIAKETLLTHDLLTMISAEDIE
ncbi:MAG: hypothetical protein JSS94_06775 [Bacteroidetes bacterium]|nr:hypothetical protein [Bacteroidota bacterium]